MTGRGSDPRHPALTSQNWVRELSGGAFASLAGHVATPPGPVIPVGDRSTLFTTAGIQYWRPWVLAADAGSDPGRMGVQWCVRMNSLDRVGHSNFLTSFCMLSVVTRGTSSRRDALQRMLEVFVDRWDLPFSRLAFSAVAEGPLAPPDTASLAALDAIGVPAGRIVLARRKWAHPFKPDGPTGPELFVLFDRLERPCGDRCGPACTCGRYVHFWNLEFLGHHRRAGGGVEQAAMPFTDSAGSLEWVTCAVTGAASVYQTPAFADSIGILRERGAFDRPVSEDRIRRLADHARTIALLLSSGVTSGPRAHGHVLRRLIRRALGTLSISGGRPGLLPELVRRVAGEHAGHPGFPSGGWSNMSLEEEIRRFDELLARGRRLVDRWSTAGAVDAGAVFRMHSTHGIPWDVIEAWLVEAGVVVDASVLSMLKTDERARSRGLA